MDKATRNEHGPDCSIHQARRARMSVLGGVFILLLLAGCTVPDVSPPVTVSLEIVDEDQGWVQVRVTGVPSSGYTLHWGDAEGSYGTTGITPSIEVYEHFYQAVEGTGSGVQIPTDYGLVVTDAQGNPVAQGTVHIESVNCHVSLVSQQGRSVTVRYWGRFGIEYSVSWGDQFADHVMVSTQSATGIETHTYLSAGTYSIGMEEIWAPRQVFFTIDVE